MTQPTLDFNSAPLAQASTRRPSLTDKLAKYFAERPNRWIDGRELSRVAGFYAYRTRVSECRTILGMNIENRVRRVTALEADPSLIRTPEQPFSISEYRYVPTGEQA